MTESDRKGRLSFPRLLTALIYGLLLAAASFKIMSMQIRSFDPYLYSYVASGQDLATFKQTPGLPPEWVAMPEQKFASSREYYMVKPLYLALTRIAIPITGTLDAPFLVSVVAYFSLAWVVWNWLGALCVTGLWRTLAALLLMFSSVVTMSAREGLPDMLCTLLLAGGAWLILSTKVPHAGALLLVGAIFGRSDSLVLAGLILLVAAWRQRISVRAFAVWAFLMLLSEFWVARQGPPYGQLLAANLENHSYLYALLHNAPKTEVAIYAPFMLLALLAIKLRFQTDLIVACFVSWIIRYLLIPKLETRYLLPQAVIIGIVAAASVLKANRDNHPELECERT